MDRRALLLGGFAATVGAVSAGAAVDTLRPSGESPRSTRPHGATERALVARVVWHTAPGTRQVALTFDDGPSTRWTPQVLDMLARHGVPATFFVVGSRAQEHSALVSRAFDAGHEIGNHTWTHADLCRISPAKVNDELQRTAEVVERLTGRAPSVIRPPWGYIDAVGLMAAAQLDCDVVLWSELIQADDAAQDLARTLRDVRVGSVVLAHDGGPTPTPAELRAVDALIGGLVQRGYTFGTVGELLAEQPVAPPPSTVAAVALSPRHATS